MNPHADSVQQPSETLAREILEICRGWSQATFGWQGDDPDGFSKASRAHDEECICRIVAALSRQAPAAPAAVDFEQWWLAEVAANGGVPIGADYKHWAKKGFELRGDARAPVAPVERTYELGQKHEREAWLAATGWDSTPRSLTGALPNAFYKVFGDGVVPTSRDQKMWLAGYYAASTPSSPTQALLGWTRYEKARKLNVAQWAELHQRNLRGENFDDMIDALPATTQPVQQGAPTPAEPAKTEARELSEQEKRSLIGGYFAEDWAIEHALGLLHDYHRAALSTPPTPEAEPAQQDTKERHDALDILDDRGQVDVPRDRSVRDAEQGGLVSGLGRVANLVATQPSGEVVTEFNVGRWCLSEDECIADRIDFRSYELGVIDAARAFGRNRATPPAEKQAAPAADQQPSNLEDFREAVRDMEAAALKVENDWRSTDAAVLEAQEKQERAKQLLARIDGARQLPNWRGAKQAAPSGETARFRRALTDIKYKAVSLADAQVIALRALNGFDSDYPRATPAPQDTKRADNHG